MRLLDPFAGYSLANGISIFHVALWFASFTVYGYTYIFTWEDVDPTLTNEAAQ